jgi:hypothetical protein
MITRERVPMTYSRAELLSDAAVHVTGIVAALIAVPVLVTLAAVWFGDATTIITATTPRSRSPAGSIARATANTSSTSCPSA